MVPKLLAALKGDTGKSPLRYALGFARHYPKPSKNTSS